MEILALWSILSILPITYGGLDTDGKQILQILKREKFNKMSKDEKNYETIINQTDMEIARLKKLCKDSPFEFTKSKYIAEVMHKAYTQVKMGKVEESVITLKEIHNEVLECADNTKILYYNNLLYSYIVLEHIEDADEIYDKLLRLLSIEENKIYENADVLDTIETYKAYKSTLQ